MNNAKMTYFKEEDVLYLAISEGKETNSVELFEMNQGKIQSSL
jgi:uncharacterized protein YuzE